MPRHFRDLSGGPKEVKDVHQLGLTLDSRFDSSETTQVVQVVPASTLDRSNAFKPDVDPRVEHPAAAVARRAPGPEARRIGLPALYCARIPDGVVLGRIPMALTSTGDWVGESLPKSRRAPELAPETRAALQSDLPYVDDDVLIVGPVTETGSKWTNYFHWMTEGFTRAVLAQAAGVPSVVGVLFPFAIKDLHRETLAAAGFDPERLIAWDGHPTRFRRVYAPSRVPKVPNCLPPHLTQLVSELGRARAAPPAGAGRRIFISRLRASRRAVANEAELHRVAVGLGFEVVDLAELRLKDQIELMGDTEILIGLHGAGLTNTLFMPSGSLLVEVALASLENGREACFQNLAAARAQPYALHITVNPPDPDHFARFLELAVNGQQSPREASSSAEPARQIAAVATEPSGSDGAASVSFEAPSGLSRTEPHWNLLSQRATGVHRSLVRFAAALLATEGPRDLDVSEVDQIAEASLTRLVEGSGVRADVAAEAVDSFNFRRGREVAPEPGVNPFVDLSHLVEVSSTPIIIQVGPEDKKLRRELERTLGSVELHRIPALECSGAWFASLPSAHVTLIHIADEARPAHVLEEAGALVRGGRVSAVLMTLTLDTLWRTRPEDHPLSLLEGANFVCAGIYDVRHLKAHPVEARALFVNVDE